MIVTREIKGGPLTYEEMDNNFKACENLKGKEVPTSDIGTDGDHYAKLEKVDAESNTINFSFVLTTFKNSQFYEAFPPDNKGSVEENDVFSGGILFASSLIGETSDNDNLGITLKDKTMLPSNGLQIQVQGKDFIITKDNWNNKANCYVINDPLITKIYNAALNSTDNSSLSLDISVITIKIIPRAEYVKDDNKWVEVKAPLFESIDEGNGLGIRLAGKDSEYYTNIGLNSFDLSVSDKNDNTMGAGGNYSLAFGLNNKTIGEHSLVFGKDNTGNANSLVFGVNNEATSSYGRSLIFGDGNKTTDYSLVFGENNTGNNKSLVFGTSNQVTGKHGRSLIFGEDNIGNANSLVFGIENQVSNDGQYSLMFGQSNTVTCMESLITGESIKSIDISGKPTNVTLSQVIGKNLNLKNIQYSFILSQNMQQNSDKISNYFLLGDSNTINNISGALIGNNLISPTTTESIYSTTLGQYNTAGAATDAFILGIGTTDKVRKNGLVINYSGAITAPELSTDLITNPKSLTTKEYVDNLATAGANTGKSITVVQSLPAPTLDNYETAVYVIDDTTEYVCVSNVLNPTSDSDCFWLQR